jgi:hypothetical protein
MRLACSDIRACMARNVAAAEAIVDAPTDTVYGYLADMRDHHPRFLPPAFSDFQVEPGGVGAGTVTRFKMTAGGRTRQYRMKVAEPEPGRVLTESDMDSSAVKLSAADLLDQRLLSRSRPPRSDPARQIWQAPGRQPIQANPGLVDRAPTARPSGGCNPVRAHTDPRHPRIQRHQPIRVPRQALLRAVALSHVDQLVEAE